MKPQDLVVLTKVLLKEKEGWTYQQIAHDILMSSSECHAAIQRSTISLLYNPATKKINKTAFKEFIVYGLKYVYPVEIGKISRGVLTAFPVGPLKELLVLSENASYIWPYALGNARGQSIEPLYKSVPQIVGHDERFYTFMILFDLIRMGRSRERNAAVTCFESML